VAAPHSCAPGAIGGVAPEQRRADKASRHGQVATEPTPHRADDQLLAGRDGDHLSRADGLALQAQIGRPADDRHEGRAQAAQGRAAGRDLEGAGTGAIADQFIGQSKRVGIGRAGGRNPERGQPLPAPVLQHGPQARLVHLEDGSAPRR
jgi:hypothetical protein